MAGHPACGVGGLPQAWRVTLPLTHLPWCCYHSNVPLSVVLSRLRHLPKWERNMSNDVQGKGRKRKMSAVEAGVDVPVFRWKQERKK
jgi:hypothetical protein